MIIKTGTILISTNALDNSVFEKSIIFIYEYNEKGATGFVINKLFPRVFNELTAFRHSKNFPLYEGGPVEQESLYFLHCRPDLIAGGTHIVDSIYLGGDFKQAVALINDNVIGENDIKLLVGYCGWDAQQLEEEIEEGSWRVVDISANTVFASVAETL